MVRGDVTKGFVLGFATCLLLMFYTSFFMKCSDNVCDQRQQQLLDENVRQTIGSKRSIQPSPKTLSDITEVIRTRAPPRPEKSREVKFKTVAAKLGASKLLKDKHVETSKVVTGVKTRAGPRIMCWIMTTYANLMRKAIHVHDTWGHRCDKILYIISNGTEEELPNQELPTNETYTELNKEDDYAQSDRILPVITFEDIPEGRHHLTAKTMAAFNYLYHNYVNEFDWFLKADDDTYIVMENLRHFLSQHNRDKPQYFGHHFEHLYMLNGYNSGGSGYVLSREALKRFGPNHRKNDNCDLDGQDEDVAIGRCMEALRVRVGNTADEKGAIRFLCFEIEKHLMGKLPQWLKLVDAYGAKAGISSISRDVISFHYVEPWMMYLMEYFIYNFSLRPQMI